MEFGVYDLTLLIGMVTGAVAAIKTAFTYDSRWSPLIAVALGVGVTFAWGFHLGIDFDNGQEIADALLVGIFPVGLGSVGLYSGAKNVSEAIRKPEQHNGSAKPTAEERAVVTQLAEQQVEPVAIETTITEPIMEPRAAAPSSYNGGLDPDRIM